MRKKILVDVTSVILLNFWRLYQWGKQNIISGCDWCTFDVSTKQKKILVDVTDVLLGISTNEKKLY